MSKQLKGTRIRGLPPKVLLSRRQDATGSFPTVWRTSSDNRTGKYNVFFNDTKVINFNQKTAPQITINPASYTTPEYKEQQITVGNKVSSQTVSFPGSAFSSAPIVVVGEVASTDYEENINVFVTDVTTTGFKANFSPTFKGTFVYRAVLETSPPGQVSYVERTPRYPGVYTTLVAGQATIAADYGFSLTHDYFDTIVDYITYYDYQPSLTYEADIYPTYINSTTTGITVGDSAFVADSIKANYIGVDDSRTSPPTPGITVQGIVYPLVMTPQAITQSLSNEDIIDLYKQPYLDGSTLRNLPIIATGSMIRGVSDEFVTFTPGQEIEPFKDFGNAAVDGKKTVANPFYATGSIPVTFDQPLWSKSKFEISLTTSVGKVGKTKIYTYKDDPTHYSGSFGPMMYWDTSLQQFVGLDSYHLQQEISPGSSNDLKKFLNRQHIGFGYSMDSNKTIYDQELLSKPYSYIARGNQISNFGFPYHEKFKPSSTQSISMQDYISEPFLVEKIVLYTSACIDFGVIDTLNVSTSSYAQWTFFVLNERSTFPQLSEPKTIVASINNLYNDFLTSSQISTTVRDVVDFIRIGVVNDNQIPTIYQTRELTLTKSLSDRYIAGQFVISSSLKNSHEFVKGIRSVWAGKISDASQNAFIEKNFYSGRDGLNSNFMNGRNWINVSDDKTTVGTATYDFPVAGTMTVKSSYSNSKNPYLLLPTDKLVFGWQMPLDMDQFVVSSSMEFANQGINKVVFYGSLLRLNDEDMLAEHHDTLNQLLSSETIHEVIG